MMQKKEARKKLIVFLCFIIFLHINPFIPSSLVVMGNELETEEGEQDPDQTEEGEEFIKQSEAQQDLAITILTPETGLSFNELIEVNGEVTGSIEETVEITLLVYNYGEEDVFKQYEKIAVDADDHTWIYVINLSETENEDQYVYEDGTYLLQATLNDDEEISSNEVTFTVDRKAPEIEITSPTSDLTNQAIIAGETESGAIVTLYIEGETEAFTDPIISNDEGKFVFELNELQDGKHTFIVTVTNELGNIAETEITFVYDGTSPFVSTNSLFPKPNMSQVSVETLKVKAKIMDENIDLTSVVTPIEVTEQGTGKKVTGTYDIVDETIIFTPNSGEIKPNTKYFVIINPTITDKAGNFIHSRNWSFTTATSTNVGSPHGGYTNNTNSCKICHGVHAASEPKIEQVNLEYADDPNKELKEKVVPDAINGYCMTCHDGTVASNMTNHQNKKSDHNMQLVRKGDNKVVSQSCGNCHNVHLDSHSSNPNLLKDHFVFDHVGIAGVGKIDSSERLCESCHQYDLLDVLNEDQYQVFSYRHWNTSQEEIDGDHFGSVDDYRLCLRCHNEEYANTYKNVEDIETHYKNTNSGHNIAFSKIKDGTLLDGNMPCATCHETHSSPNDKLIKSELGVNADLLIGWSSSDERSFCLSCHNNETEVFGITVPLPMTRTNGNPIGPHQSTSDRACSDCHGGESKTFVEAAHSPSRRGN
ncbi:hypothetical protein BKP45_06835 [Anaerobacillus alkalidiazotrophicus]|uniref:Uncharacterized protein n=1 Tax=Anaerobacillus alkalidiazotrophicus TaxID=472963 RepID=A0A1S2MER4_9BACI|nr:Ig-like domain-containing protein [Anaerobacillus alkalidiazotrophicus]OIJ22347.1 hypothetical protein BKP45_06835 [Anaerobacillus alkalidiazotrophicus]